MRHYKTVITTPSMSEVLYYQNIIRTEYGKRMKFKIKTSHIVTVNVFTLYCKMSELEHNRLLSNYIL